MCPRVLVCPWADRWAADGGPAHGGPARRGPEVSPMPIWMLDAIRGLVRRAGREDGQADAFVVALAIFILILILAGRRVVVQ